MEPVPRTMLCQVEPPPRTAPATSPISIMPAWRARIAAQRDTVIYRTSLSDPLARRLFGENDKAALMGKRVLINDDSSEVVGVLAAEEEEGE